MSPWLQDIAAPHVLRTTSHNRSDQHRPTRYSSSRTPPLRDPTPTPCPPVSLKSAAPSRSLQSSNCGRPWAYPSIPPHLSRALPPAIAHSSQCRCTKKHPPRLICLVATSKPAVAADPLGSAGGRARNALAAPRDCAGGGRRVGEHGRAIIIGREVPAANVLVEGDRVVEHPCTRTHEAGRHGDAEARGGCEEGCGGAGRDAQLVLVTLAMFQLLMSWLKEVAP